MTRFLLPIIFVVIAIGLFFGYLDPTYQQVQVLRAEEARFDEALDKSKALQQTKDRLLAKYNAFATEDLERLEKLLPDNVDNVRLALDLNDIAAQYGMQIREVAISREGLEPEGALDTDIGRYQSILLTFLVTASYEEFLLFIQDLETSLRLVDVVGVNFGETETGAYDFQVSVRTYWLR